MRQRSSDSEPTEAEAASLIAEALLKRDTLAVALAVLKTLPAGLSDEEAAEIATVVAEMLVSEPVV